MKKYCCECGRRLAGSAQDPFALPAKTVYTFDTSFGNAAFGDPWIKTEEFNYANGAFVSLGAIWNPRYLSQRAADGSHYEI
jgi:hypothetical protein